MKTRLYKNIDLVRIPIKTGVSEYYFPQNVAWVDKTIDEIIVVAPNSNSTIDPVDGVTPVLDASQINDLYFNLYANDDTEITHDLSFEQIMHLNNHRLPIGTALNLALCRLYFTSAPAADSTLLLYVTYSSRIVEDYDVPQHSVTVEFPMDANEEINFQYIINTYLHAIPKRLKGILCWNAESTPAYVTLRDYALTYNIRYAHTELMRPDMNTGTALGSQLVPFYTDDLDIDFDYSNIRNALNTQVTQKLTFLY